MSRITITRRKLGGSWSWIYALLLGIVGVVILTGMPLPWSLIPAAPLLAMTIVMGFGTEVTELDFGTLKFRTCFSFFGSRSGAYESLPVLDHILIRDFHQSVRSLSGDRYRSDEVMIELSLVAKKGGKLVLCWSEDKAEVERLARKIGRLAGLQVVDNSRA